LIASNEDRILRRKPPLAKPRGAGDNRAVDAGNQIRFRIRSKKAKSMKRGSSSSRSDWLSKTGCILSRFLFQRDEVEFPAASQTDCKLWIFRDSRATDRVRSRRTLRPVNNLITEDQHELAFIRETPAPRARSLSTTGRARTFSRSTRSTRTRAGFEAENILATRRGIFRGQRRKPKKAGSAIA